MFHPEKDNLRSTNQPKFEMQIVDVLLALLFLSSAIIFIRSFTDTKAFYSVMLLSSAALSTLFFERLFHGSGFSIHFLYPWILPLLFVVGPSYYLSNSKTVIAPIRALIHFTPALLMLGAILIHMLIFTDDFNRNISNAVAGEFHNSELFWIFSDDLLILIYTIHGGSYVYFSLLKFIEKKSHSNYYITITLLLSLFAFWEYLNQLFYGFSITELSIHDLRLISIVGAFGLAAYYLFYYKTLMPKMAPENTLENTIPITVNSVTNTVSPIIEHYQANYTNYNNDLFEKISLYLTETIHSQDSEFFDPRDSKESIIQKSSFTPSEWESYFSFQKRTFSEIKQEIRINRALFLIEGGYLTNNTIEDLTKAIGYKSRSHFYRVFKKVMGVSFSKFQRSKFIGANSRDGSENLL